MTIGALSQPRRRLISLGLRIGGGALGLAGFGSALLHAAAPADRQRFMARALEMPRIAVQRGDQAFGAVVVKNGEVVGEGVSAVLTAPDPTAHGEMQAIRDAARRLGTHRLTGCEMYTTFKPCAMCETAAYWAGIERVYHGEGVTDGGMSVYRGC